MGSGCFSIVFVFFCFDDDYWFDYVDVFGYFYEVFFVFNVFYVDEDCFCVFIFFEVFEEVSVVDVVFVFNVNYSGEIDFFEDCLVYKGYFKGIVLVDEGKWVWENVGWIEGCVEFFGGVNDIEDVWVENFYVVFVGSFDELLFNFFVFFIEFIEV